MEPVIKVNLIQIRGYRFFTQFVSLGAKEAAGRGIRQQLGGESEADVIGIRTGSAAIESCFLPKGKHSGDRR